MTDLPKIPKHDLPVPEKRRKASPKQVAAILKRQSGTCNLCPMQLVEFGEPGEPTRILQPFDVDHVQRLDALGDQGIDNLQCLCKSCHVVKTKVDNREAKKGARIRKKSGHDELKPRVKKRIAGRALTVPKGFKHKWPKRAWPSR